MKIRSEGAVPRCQFASLTIGRNWRFLTATTLTPSSKCGAGSRLEAKHRRMMRLQHFAVPQIHVHAARQTRIEAPHRAHDINSLELVRTVLLKDRGVLHRVLVWTRSAVDVARIGIPGGRRIGVV